ERPGQSGSDLVVDVDVGHEPRIDDVLLRLEVEDRERASPDRSEKQARVLPAGQHDDPSWLASEHLSRPAGAVAVARQIAVATEGLNLVAPDPSEARRGRGHFRHVQERDIDSERDTRGAAVHRAAQRGLAPEALDGG